jgi:hypothetical protein
MHKLELAFGVEHAGAKGMAENEDLWSLSRVRYIHTDAHKLHIGLEELS